MAEIHLKMLGVKVVEQCTLISQCFNHRCADELMKYTKYNVYMLSFTVTETDFEHCTKY